MTKPRPKRKPTFLGQAALIVLPVVVLAAVGLFSLRQDRRLVEQEARERAQQIADELAEKIGETLTNIHLPHAADGSADLRTTDAPTAAVSFQISVQNELLCPPPVAALAPHLLAAEGLSDDQARLWERARTAEFSGPDPSPAIDLYRQFLASVPPKDFAGVAGFSLGLLLAKEKRYVEAARQFTLIIEKYPETVLESGLPLRALAHLKLIEIAAQSSDHETQLSPDWLETVCSNAVFRPGLLTPHLLEQVAQLDKSEAAHARHWLALWKQHDRARQLYTAASRLAGDHSRSIVTLTGIMDDPQFGTRTRPPGAQTNETRLTASTAAASFPRLFWIHSDGDWLAATAMPEAAGIWVVCRPESEIHRVVNERIGNNRNLPDYFGVSVEIAGRNLIAVTNLDREVEGPLDKNVGPARAQSNARRFPSQVLAVDRANSALSDQLKVHVQLTRPTALYARQRTRTLWFGLLISASTCAALAGLATAWAAFRRQLRLAEMKTNFVSSVSHELRAPIASVRLMAESLDRGTVSDAHKQTEYFRLIVQECRRLTSLIENVLDFSRIDQGRRQYEFEPTDLGALVRQTIQLMEPNAAERQITLSGTVPPEPITADLDGKAIQQALINLLDNAIKHSPPETGVTVGLEMSLNSQPSTVNLFVEDHGGGIPPEEHGKIFEPFYRRGTELRRETQGIGIGLTIVKHIVEAHGGKATVRSAVGQGSRFTIELPVKNGETPFRE